METAGCPSCLQPWAQRNDACGSESVKLCKHPVNPHPFSNQQPRARCAVLRVSVPCRVSVLTCTLTGVFYFQGVRCFPLSTGTFTEFACPACNCLRFFHLFILFSFCDYRTVASIRKYSKMLFCKIHSCSRSNEDLIFVSD